MNLFSNKNNVITYTVNKAATSNLYISVQSGEVVINAPWYTTSSQIQQIVEQKRQWILNKINEYEEACEKRKEYTKLKIVKLLGHNYDLAIKYKAIKWLALTALAAALLPLLLLGRYAVPAADDFSYGSLAHVAFVESGSVMDAAAAAFDKTLESYYSWQGTFSAIFLMALQPAVFSEALYALTPLIMLASILAGSFMFCRAFFGELMVLDRDVCGIVAAVLCLL